MTLDPEIEQRIEEPAADDGGARSATDAGGGGRAHADPAAGARQPAAPSGARAGERRPAAQGLVARLQRQRGRPAADQRPLLGPHPDRRQHRAEAPPPADEARDRAVRRPRLRDAQRGRGGRRRPRRVDPLRRDVRPSARPRGLEPLPRRAEAARAPRGDLRGARPHRHRVRGAAGDHEPSRRRRAAVARGRHPPGRRRARHGEGPLADPLREGPGLDALALRGRGRGGR